MTNVLEISSQDARRITDQIKAGVEAVWHLIEQAYTTRAWSVLGYPSWDDYCTREFGTSRLRLPREERQEVVASLRESGLSIRAIAAATGVSRDTVHKSLDTCQKSDTSEHASITGTDGKTYTPKPSPVSRDVAAYARVGVHTIYDALRAGELEGYQINGKPTNPWRTTIESLDRWIRGEHAPR